MAELSSRDELANNLGTVLSALLLSGGLLSIVAIGSGQSYSLLYSPYCTFSLNCLLEALISSFAYTNIIVLFLDVLALYALWRYAARLVPIKFAFASLIAGGYASLYAEGLLRAYSGDVKGAIVGAGGIAALAAIAINYPREWAKPIWFRLGDRVVRLEPRPWLVSALYLLARAAIGLAHPRGTVTTLTLGVTAGYVVGAFIYLLTGKGPRERGPLSAAIALLTISWISVALYGSIPSFAEISGTSLAIYSTTCYLCYSLYRGFLSGCDSIRSPQKFALLPSESVPSGSESLIPPSARGVWYLECSTTIDKAAAAHPHALLINVIIISVLNSIAAFVIYKSISSPARPHLD